MANTTESLDAADDPDVPAPAALEVVSTDARETAGRITGDDLDRVISDLQKFGSRFRQPSPRQSRLDDLSLDRGA